jgi:hypothetical protein
MFNPSQRLVRPAPVVALVGVALAACCLFMAWHGNEPAAAAGPGDAVSTELRPQVQELLALYGQGKIDDMLQRMPVAPAQNRDDFENLRRELIGLTNVAGRYQGFDIVTSLPLSGRYCELYVLAYFEKEPILFDFGFYKAGDAWQVQRFKVRPDIDTFLDAMLARKP